MGLISKDAGNFGVLDYLDVLNFDAEESVGKCQTPLTHSQRFMITGVVKPVGLVVGLFVAKPIWNYLRRIKIKLVQEKLWKKQEAPPEITNVHMWRGGLNIFLALYAPVTRSSIEMLVCKQPCDDC
eukprot:SAG11_NODE_5330_length_1594_cov_1.137793_1_plen_125_part_10